MFLRFLPWRIALLVGLGMLGYTGYRLADHQHGVGPLLLGAGGVSVVVRCLSRARDRGPRP